jgi:hypothetical protein
MIYKLNENNLFHYYEMRIIQDDILQKWYTVQKGFSIQQTFTPFELVFEILEKVGKLDNKDVLVIANSEIFLLLKTLKKYKLTNYKSITFLTDIESLEGKEGVKVVDFNKISDISIDMKYDVIIGNPPFNDESTTSTDTRRGFRGGYFVKFIDTALRLTKGSVVMISPSRGWMSGKYRSKNLELYKQKGLTHIYKCDKFFDIDISGVCYYIFDVNAQGRELIVDELKPKYESPVNNLQKYHNRSKGAPRKVIDSLEQDENGIPVYCTTSIKIFVKDASAVNDRHSNYWRVGFNANGTSIKAMGKVIIVRPGEHLSGSVNYLLLDSEESAKTISKHLTAEKTVEIMKETRISAANSGYHMSFVSDPLI